MVRGFLQVLLLGGTLAFLAAAAAVPSGGVANVAQDWMTRTWETGDGLPENSATAMVQAADGHLWFGTWNGLVKFDGVKFIVLTPANTPGLPSSGIVQLHLDRQGRLWVSTLGGLVRRDATGWSDLRTPEGAVVGAVRSFAERPSGDLLVTTHAGDVFEASGDRWIRLPAPPGAPDEGYFGAVDGDGRWWVAQYRFVGFWDGRRWQSAVPPEQLAGWKGEDFGLTSDAQGDVWLLMGVELRGFRGGREVLRRPLAAAPESVWSLHADSRSNLWVCTSHRGLGQISPDGVLRRWAPTEELAFAGVRFVFEDREGNLWVGTNGSGLSRLKPRRFGFYGREQGLSQRIVTSISPGAGGAVWIGTYGRGLFRLRGGRLEPMDWPNHPANIQSVLCDRAGRVWVGTFNEGLWMSESGATGGFRRLGDGRTAGENVVAMFEDTRGRIWISGGKGVSTVEDEQFEMLAPDSKLPLHEVRCFEEDSSGAIWFANPEGVFRVQGNRLSEVRDAAGKSVGQVLCLKSDPDGVMWLGTEDRGVMRWRAGDWTQVAAAQGLPVTGVNGIAEDLLGNFWLTSGQGIIRVARSDLESVADGRAARLACQWLDGDDGLPSPGCSAGHQPTCGRDAAGQLWFATSKGAAVTDPAGFRLNSMVPLPQIERLLVHGRSTREGSPVEVSAPFPVNLELPTGSRRLEVQFTAPSFAKPERTRFQIRLDDKSEGPWRDVGVRRMVYFDEVAPGAHVFRVRAVNGDGVGGGEAALAFFVPPRFWQTTWFSAAVGVAVAAEAGLLGGIVLLQRRRRRAEAEVQRQRTELAHVSRVVTVGELTASLAHELNHPQSAILSNAQAGEMFLNAEPPELEEVRKIFADIVRDNRRASQILTRLRTFLTKRELAFEPVDINGLVGEILPLIETDAGARGVALKADLGPGLPPIQGDRVHLQQVLLNLLLNALDAVAEVPKGRREVRLETRVQDQDHVRVAVADSGPGIPADRLDAIFAPFVSTKPGGMGMGLAIARTLVEAHRGRIWAQNNAEGGATFQFTLPTTESPP
ncbi:MAG: GHKL domain-containing protein [Verrucomicrobiales bacterium]|nr:GHKL domain-containing protein [Verrucomicrobiales bacterium]